MFPSLSMTGGRASSDASNSGEQTLHGDLGLTTGDGNRGFVNNVNFGSGSVDADGSITGQSGLFSPWIVAGIVAGCCLAIFALRRK